MDVIEAILKRSSIRDFSSKPVPKETIMKIFETAVRSPSGGNAQPWEVFIAGGATLERIRNVYRDRFEAGTGSSSGPTASSSPGGPPPQPKYIQERMATNQK
jgi:nitroreductase